MADHVLSILPSKLCAATALCSKLILIFYNNEEHIKIIVLSLARSVDARFVISPEVNKFIIDLVIKAAPNGGQNSSVHLCNCINFLCFQSGVL